jgi:hypothetical protein
MVLLIIPVIVLLMWLIRRHYDSVQTVLALDETDLSVSSAAPPHVVVPVANLDRAALHALAFAQSISADVVAVHIAEDREEAERARERWESLGGDVRLVIVESPFRSLLPPLLAYIDAVDESDPDRPITIVLSEFVPRHWWEWLLHNQTALRLKLRLFFRRNTIVIDVPYHLDPGGLAASGGIGSRPPAAHLALSRLARCRDSDLRGSPRRIVRFAFSRVRTPRVVLYTRYPSEGVLGEMETRRGYRIPELQPG